MNDFDAGEIAYYGMEDQWVELCALELLRVDNQTQPRKYGTPALY
jgi:hypothetical protein